MKELIPQGTDTELNRQEHSHWEELNVALEVPNRDLLRAIHRLAFFRGVHVGIDICDRIVANAAK